MSVRDRIDPEVAEGLAAFFAFAGPGGFFAIKDLDERRATFNAMLEGAAAQVPPNERVTFADQTIPGPEGAPDLRVRVYRPVGVEGPLPGIYYVHGGGFIVGSIETEHLDATALCDQQNAVVVSVDYRLAPEHPHPAPVEDCYAGLVWMGDHLEELGIDPDRLAIRGASAGGGLVASTVLLARDRRGPALAYQMLLIPMLDDRPESPSAKEIVDLGVFDTGAAMEGWTALLGDAVSGADVSEYAAPARATDLSGLPPAFIDAGELDALRDEAIDYAQRLLQAGISVELHVWPGAIHGAELFAPTSKLAGRIREARRAALNRVLREPAKAGAAE
jgi:acetyl esterase/lipase